MNDVVGKGWLAQQAYAAHLSGGSRRFANNPATNRLAAIERMYMRVLTELACNRFKWENLPDSVNPRFLEMTLFGSALSVFFYEEKFGKFLSLKGTGARGVNLNNDPVAFTVIGAGYAGRTLTASNHVNVLNGEVITSPPECVPIWANYLRVPDLDIVMIYATKFAQLDRSIEIATNAARRSRIAVVDENNQKGVTNLIRQIDQGDAVIQVNRPIDGILQTLDLGVEPRTIEQLHIVKARLWNECMTLLGINASNQDKKERLVADEVHANDEQVESTRAINLNARRQACESINELFGDKLPYGDISVSYHTDEKNVIPDMVGNVGLEEEEGGDSDNVHTTA